MVTAPTATMRYCRRFYFAFNARSPFIYSTCIFNVCQFQLFFYSILIKHEDVPALCILYTLYVYAFLFAVPEYRNFFRVFGVCLYYVWNKHDFGGKLDEIRMSAINIFG